MAARAIWKGVLNLGKAHVPVRFYSAVEDRDVHFRLLHAKDKEPVTQQMVNPETGKPVPPENIRKGFEVDPGVFVLLDADELASLEPEPSRDVEVKLFVAPRGIAPQLYERPYWLGPDGDQNAYLALAQALAAKQQHGIVSWTMRKKRYVGSLHSDGEHLMVVTLRFGDEVVLPAQLEAPAGPELRAAERRMAEQLVAALEGPFDPSEFHDEFRERVLDLVQRKARGGRVKRAPRPEPKRREVSLESALEHSLRDVQKQRKTA
ncbi:MAG TPA: Ku protein [Thermoanaerobaculia bacterium]|jgi:DNA end-binding protein Ku|nr:Ku protein [Thermoanaerobaculia bacterium]